MQAYLYDGYWEDIGTVKAFYESNLALTDENPNFRCADKTHAGCLGCRISASLPATGTLQHEIALVMSPSSCVSKSLCSFYDKDAPIYTMSRFLPPSKVLDAEVTNSILGDGCVVRLISVLDPKCSLPCQDEFLQHALLTR